MDDDIKSTEVVLEKSVNHIDRNDTSANDLNYLKFDEISSIGDVYNNKKIIEVGDDTHQIIINIKDNLNSSHRSLKKDNNRVELLQDPTYLFDEYQNADKSYTDKTNPSLKSLRDKDFHNWVEAKNGYIDGLINQDDQIKNTDEEKRLFVVLGIFFNQLPKQDYLDKLSAYFFPDHSYKAYQAALQFANLKKNDNGNITAGFEQDRKNIAELNAHLIRSFYVLANPNICTNKEEIIPLIKYNDFLIQMLDTNQAGLFSSGNTLLQTLGKTLMIVGIALAVVIAALAIASWSGFALPAVMMSWLASLQSMAWIQSAIGFLATNLAFSAPVASTTIGLTFAAGVTLFGKAVQASGAPTVLRRQLDQVAVDLDKAAHAPSFSA